MFGYIKGKLVSVGANSCVVENNEMGYGLFCGQRLVGKLRARLGGDVKLFFWQKINDEELIWYAFMCREEVDLFTKLIKVSGVGPKSAISIMDLDEYDKLMEHIEKADVAFIAKASGVGRKTAQKLIVELQGKLVIDDGMPADGELVDALTSLGYKANEYRDVLDKMPGDIDRIEDKIGWVLREIGRAM